MLTFLNDIGLFIDPFWSQQYFGNSVKLYLFALITFVLLSGLFYVLKRVLLKQVKKLTDITNNKIDDVIYKACDSLKLPFLIFLAFFISIQILQIDQNLYQLLFTLIVLFGVAQAISVIDNSVKFAFLNFVKDKSSSYSFIAGGLFQTLIKILLWMIGILFVLSNLGVNIVSLLAGLGIGGVAIALALQNILEDLFSSFAIYFDKPFAPGEFIIVGEYMGVVEKIGIKTTRLRSLTGEEIIIANKELTSARIRNYKSMKERRVEFMIGLPFDTNSSLLKQFPKYTKEAFKKIKDCKLDRVNLKAFGDYSYDYEIVYYVATGDHNKYMDINEKIHLKLNKILEDHGISPAYPHQLVHLKN